MAAVDDTNPRLPAVGSEFAGYRIDAVLWTDDRSAAYVATKTASGRRFTLRVVSPSERLSTATSERWRTSVSRTVALGHRHLAPVHDAGEPDGLLYLAMPPLAMLLTQHLARTDATPPDVLRQLRDVASALDAAHAGGLVHGRLTVSSILVSEDGETSLTGFGELLPGEPRPPAAQDLAAFATVIHECLARASTTVPYQHEADVAEVLRAGRATASELVDAVELATRGQGPSARRDPRRRLTTRTRLRRPRLVVEPPPEQPARVVPTRLRIDDGDLDASPAGGRMQITPGDLDGLRGEHPTRPEPPISVVCTIAHDRTSFDIALEGRANTTVGAVELAIAGAWPQLSLNGGLWSQRLGRQLDAQATLGSGVLRDGDVLSCGSSRTAAAPVYSASESGATRQGGAGLLFNRSPRVARPVPERQLRMEAPPQDPSKVRLPLLASLLPILIAVPAAYFIGQWYILLFVLLSPMMVIGTFVSDRRHGRKDHREKTARFRRRIAALDQELAAAYAEEFAARHANAPDPVVLADRAIVHRLELWERREDGDDFIRMRFGLATQPARTAVAFDPGGSDDLRAEAQAVIDSFTAIPDVPATADLPDVQAVGLHGGHAAVEGMARWLALQTATLQSPSDVVIAAAVSSSLAHHWEWLKWLPHCRSAASPLDRHLAVGRAEARALLEDVVRVVDSREEARNDRSEHRDRPARPYILLLIDEEVAPSREIITRVLSAGARSGVGAVWSGAQRRDLPGQCGVIVSVASTTSVTFADSGVTIGAVTPDTLAVDTAEQMARALSPLRDAGAISAMTSVPSRVSLLELLALPDVSAAGVEARWRRSSGGLRTDLGMGSGAPLTVDLRADGPHGLVAGTTGAGKSELLQSLVAGLAATYAPSRVTFLLVDYKGGAAFDECSRLPHTVGMVTDLDSHLTRRALISLEAELRRRERILRDVGAKDLVEMERRSLADAPASLVIVIDEFAALVREVPDFVEGVLDIAQRGRSLGVHLVLATQHPSGVVSEGIRANMNLRIALRVAKASDSDDVIGAADAARIQRSKAGRAYLRTGHGELTEFQTAYVGGVTSADDPGAALMIRPYGLEGDGGEVALHVASTPTTGATDLERLVRAVSAATTRARIASPPAPWVPELPSVLSYRELNEELPIRRRNGPTVVGLVDEPTRQRRVALDIDLERDGSLAIFGASGSGKTVMLRTIAVALAESAPPGLLHIYGLDFGHGGLRAIEGLPHCGSVIPGDDADRVTRLLAMLRRTIDTRGELFTRHRVFSLSEYHSDVTAGGALPRIVLMLDSYAGFTDAYELVDAGALVDSVPRIVAEGRALGVHVVLTADRRGAIPPSLAATISRKLVLRMANEDEYTMLGLDKRTVEDATLPPGRGFTGDGLEFQAAVVGERGDAESQARELARVVASLSQRHDGRKAPPIGALPARVSRDAIAWHATAGLRAVLGLDDVELAPAVVDLTDAHFLVAGPYRSGRSTALATIVHSLRGTRPEVELHLLAPRRSFLSEMPDVWTTVTRGMDACEQRATGLSETVLARSAEEEHVPIVVVIDDGSEFVDGPAASALEAIVRRGRDVSVRVLAGAEVAATRGYCPWLRELRKDGNGLLLDPDVNLDGELLGIQLPRRRKSRFPPGRGYLVDCGSATLVQVADS